MLTFALIVLNLMSIAFTSIAVAKYLCDNNILDNVNARGDQLSKGLIAIQAKYPTILGPSRGWGLLRGIEVIHETIKPGDIVGAAMDEGLLLVAAGYNVVRFVPPLIITEEEINTALQKFENAVAKVAKK